MRRSELAMKMRTVERGAATLVGTERGEGPPALLLHAGGESRGVWDRVAEMLANHRFRAIAYDLRGHGESSAEGCELLQTHADDVTAMLAIESTPPLLVGASLGGLAALLALAVRHNRDRTSGLVLVDVVPNLIPGGVREYLRQLGNRIADHPLVNDVLSRVEDLCAAAVELDGLPTLLVRGGRSPMSDAEVAGFLELVPGARVRTVARAAHLVAQDAPAELGTLLIEELMARRDTARA